MAMLFSLRLVFVAFLVGGVLTFAAIFGWFFYEIWAARLEDPPGAAPNLDNSAVYVAAALGGVLGSYFAASFGLQQAASTADQQLNPSVYPAGNVMSVVETMAILVYATVGMFSLVTFAFCSEQAAESLKAIVATFGGYALAMFAAGFARPYVPPSHDQGGTGDTA